MKKMVIVLLMFIASTTCFAEIVYLKSGKQVEGTVLEETDEYVKVDFFGVPITYFREDIDRIERSAKRVAAEPDLTGSKLTGSESSSIPADLFGNIAAAFQTIERQYTESTIEQEAKELFHVSAQGSLYVDFVKREVYLTSAVGDAEFDTSSMLNTIKKEIKKTGQDLSPEQKQRQAQVEQMLTGMMDTIADQTAGQKNEIHMYLNKDSFFIKLGDNWLKLTQPFVQDLWHAIERKRSGKAQAWFPASVPSVIEAPLRSIFMNLGEVYSREKVRSVTQEAYQMTPCFVLHLKEDAVVSEAALQQFSQQINKDNDFDSLQVEEAQLKVYIDKKTYRRIAKDGYFLIQGTHRAAGMPVEFLVKMHTTIEYPGLARDFSPTGNVIPIKDLATFEHLFNEFMEKKTKEMFEGIMKLVPPEMRQQGGQVLDFSKMMNVTQHNK